MTRGAFAGVRERFAQAGRPLSGHQSLSITLAMVAVGIALPLLAILPPFSGFGTQKDWISGYADAGVFVLLAIGLNVVVGLAGLLDLGYAAFFAIGAYTMAYGASGYSGLDTPFWVMLRSVHSARAGAV